MHTFILTVFIFYSFSVFTTTAGIIAGVRANDAVKVVIHCMILFIIAVMMIWAGTLLWPTK